MATAPRFAIAALLAACGSSAPKTSEPAAPTEVEVVPGPDLPGTFTPVSWLLGDWQRAGAAGSEHWVAVAGVLYGIGFSGTGYEVLILDDAEKPGPPDGTLRLTAIPGDAKDGVEFALGRLAPQSVTFTNPAHDFPTAITYAREGDRLTAVLDGPADAKGANLEPFVFQRQERQPATALEEADRAFARDSAARGGAAWAAAWDAEGSLYRGKAGRVTGPDAIGTAMTETLAKVVIEWEPVASGLAASGDLGFTVGRARYLDPDTRTLGATGSYVTIWRRQPDGAWKVLFDTGRPENLPAAVP
jgi:ketosteroid isomerase-like protein